MNPDQFATILLRWSQDNPRDLPWKTDNDPYRIWLSEIILQQTRVEQGTPYYLKFISAFPDITSLANANESDVLKLWEGLGYYSRARNLHFTAKDIVQRYNGIFPKDHSDIIALKGIGPYTAAAIASFAFGQRYAVLDGNVLRVVSRILGITEPIDTTPVKRSIKNFVSSSISNVDPASFNQALMDFGATQCTPANPKCAICPLQTHCIAYSEKLVRLIPVKSKKIIRKNRYFHFLHIEVGDTYIILNQRKTTDIWKSLYQFPVLESPNEESPTLDMVKEYFQYKIGWSIEINEKPELHFRSKQILTHQNIFAYFYKIIVETVPNKINQDHYLVERTKVSNFAFPKIMTEYWKNTNI